MTRRLLYPDTIRGFMIYYLIWIHAFNAVVYDNNPASVDSINPWVYILFAPLVLVATWAPIFSLVSGTVNAYAFHNALKNATPGTENMVLGRSLRGALVTNLYIYLMSLLNVVFFHHSMRYNGQVCHTLLTSTLHYGTLAPYNPQFFFYNDGLAGIAASGLVTSLMLYVLWRNGGYGKIGRTMAVLGIAGAVWTLSSPGLHAALDGTFWNALNEEHWGSAFLLKFVVGPNQSPFPNVAFGIFGAAFGFALSAGITLQQLRRYGYGIAGAFLALSSVCYAVQGGLQVVELTQHTFPAKVLFMNVGLMLAVCTFLADKMEYQPDARRAVAARRTMILRRISLVALTAFLTEGAISVVFSKLYLPLWTSGGVFPKTPFAIVPFIGFLFLFWDRVVRIWERHGFRYGFEWAQVRLVGWVRGRRSVRLDARTVLYPAASIVPETSPAPVD